MKKKIAIFLLAVFLIPNAYAAEGNLLNLRNRIFTDSKNIKESLTGAKDAIIINSLFDSCVITMTQLDAYFSLLGMFNTLKKESSQGQAINYLTGWLNEIKKTNELNIKSLDTIQEPIEAQTKLSIQKLRVYYTDLNKSIENELNKFSILGKTIKTKK